LTLQDPEREALPGILDRAEISRLLDVPGHQGFGSTFTPARASASLLLALFLLSRGYAARSCSAPQSMT
jgi:hypothetical protein